MSVDDIFTLCGPREVEGAAAHGVDPGSGADWEDANQRFLATALRWLRLRLALLIGGQPATVDHTTAVVQAVGQSGGHATRDLADATARELEVAMAEQRPPALVELARRLGLSGFEQEILLLCVAMELDPHMGELCAAAQGDQRLSYPTFALALELFDDPAWEVVSAGGPLRYWRLIEITQPAGQPLTTSLLRADERIVDYVKGLNELDDRLEPLVSPVDPSIAPLSASQRQAVQRIDRLLRLSGAGGAPVMDLVGTDPETKRLVAAGVARELGRRLYVLAADDIPAQPADLETVARLWRREALLLPLTLYIDAQDVDPAAPDGLARLVNRLITRSGGLIFLGTRDAWPSQAIPTVPLEVSRPTRVEQQELWRGVLGDDFAAVAAQLAGQFHLSVRRIEQISRAVTSDVDPFDATFADRLWDACRTATQPRMDALAQRLDAKATWDDIVLPVDETSLLRQLPSQVRHRPTVYETWGFAERMNRGLGISALFAGPSGTGKSMAAEVIANALRLSLYRIDLSAVVSKYIGETEKNLRRVFDAAEEGGAVLFFDEADALFGKRSEVKDSHDRYANIEINYLLQRMDEYSGVAVLATNMKAALDTAFLRRLRFIVNFPFPAVNERLRIWQKVFPGDVPLAALDLDRLASLPATGGMIHNIALNAAFVAADRGVDVSMGILLDVTRSEFRKLELPVLEPDFAWVEPRPPRDGSPEILGDELVRMLR